MSAPLLAVEELCVQLPVPGGPLPAVRSVSFALGAGEALALVGESGSGKTSVLLALLGLLGPGAVVTGSARCAGRPLLGAAEADLRRIRGGLIGTTLQDPRAALDPTQPVGRQVAEAAALHLRLGARAALDRAAEVLAECGLPQGRALLGRYPHELSGGMRQRVALAMALAAEPRLLLADEPTAALDPTVAAEVLDLLARLQARRGMGLLLVTHDLGVVARLADQVAVMYAGRIVERGAAGQVLGAPRHPYTRGLLRALPGRGEPPQPIAGAPPDPLRLPSGCAFAPRCPRAMGICAREEPRAYAAAGGLVRCWLHDPAAPEGADGDGAS